MARIGAATSRRIGPLALALAWMTIALAGPARAQVRDSIARYPSGGREVTLECFAPARAGKYPVVVLLHGSGGLEQQTGVVFRKIAGTFARRGYVALIPHFFESTGHVAGAPLATGEYEVMLDSIKDAIDYAATRPGVDPGRIGVVGFSMGSNMAMVRAVRDPRIKAVASWSGSYPPLKPSRKLPPLLILHGSEDDGTGLDLVRKYQEGLAEQEMPHEVHIYRGAGHNFDLRRSEDAAARSVAFFDKHVKAPAPAR